MPTYVVDAHALLFFLGDDPRLGPVSDKALSDAESILILPVIALAEALWITSSKKVDLNPEEVLAALDRDARFAVHAMDESLVRLAHSLSRVSEMHDRQIVATALLHHASPSGCVLLTRDADIVASGLVPTAW